MAISRLNLVSINFDKYRYNEVLLKLLAMMTFILSWPLSLLIV